MDAAGLVLLGPQRLTPTVKEAVADTAAEAAREGPIATITAGWEEREDEDQELDEHLFGRTLNLELYRRTEDVLARDPELFTALRSRHDDLRRVQALYRLRLGFAMGAARALLERRARDEGDRFLGEAIEDAIETVRVLDREHFLRLVDVHGEFDAAWLPGSRDVVAAHRTELATAIDAAAAVCIAGGHVAILLNRLRLFDLAPLLAQKPLFAWSAGAMALSERVVVFHDSPPQGMGNAEVLEAGLGLFQGVIALPHARRRLRLEDRVRVELFARRFAPTHCVALDEGARLRREGHGWSAGPNTRRLMVTGEVIEMAEIEGEAL